MAYKKITEKDLIGVGVIGLDDTPQLPRSEMQRKFEQTSREVIIPAFNNFVDAVEKRDEETYTKAETQEYVGREVAKIIGGESDFFAQKPFNVYTELLASDWAGEGPYTQTVIAEGILATDEPIADVMLSSIVDDALPQEDAWSCVSKIITGDGSVTAICFESRPEVNITARLKVVR